MGRFVAGEVRSRNRERERRPASQDFRRPADTLPRVACDTLCHQIVKSNL